MGSTRNRVLMLVLSAGLILTSCSTNSLPVNSKLLEIEDAQEDYNFSTKALSIVYMKRKMKKLLNTNNGNRTVKELTYAKIKHPALPKQVTARVPSLYDLIINMPEVQSQSAANKDFSDYIATLRPFKFSPVQQISTRAATAFKHFTINNEDYLAVANSGDTTYTNYSEIYKWDGTQFNLIQSIKTFGAQDCEFFTINNQSYLAIANYNDDTQGAGNLVNSKVYKWNGLQFDFYQDIPTKGSNDLEYFTINNEHYLASANYYDGSSMNINSEIFKWDGNNFVSFQPIPTSFALDFKHFSINNEHFLCVANYANQNFATKESTNINSNIYKWNNTTFKFDLLQNIPTYGGSEFEAFSIDGDYYIAVANAGNIDEYNLNSKIYKWNGKNFDFYQNIPTSGSYNFTYFNIDGVSYLAFNNYLDNASPSTNANSKVFLWNEDDKKFEFYQNIATKGGYDFEYFSINGKSYLAGANLYDDVTGYNTQSPILEFK